MRHRLKIAFQGNFSAPHSTESDMAAAMRAIGHEVRQIQEGAPWDQIIRHAEGADVFWWTQTKSLADLQPIEDRAAGIETLSAMMPTVATHLDLWFGLGREDQLRTEPYFRSRYVFSADGDHQAEFEALGINHRWLLPGVRHDACRFVAPRPEFEADVVFVGGWYEYGHPEWRRIREAMLQALREHLGERFQCWPRRGQPAVRGDDLNALYASAKIVIGDSCFADRSDTVYVSDRYTETVGRGGFLLAPRIMGVRSMLQEMEHCACFWPGRFDDMIDAVDHWLRLDQQREGVREAGMRHVRDHHTYVHRVEQVIDTLRQEGAL